MRQYQIVAAPPHATAVEYESFRRTLFQHFNQQFCFQAELCEACRNKHIQKAVHQGRHASRLIGQPIDRAQRMMQTGSGFEWHICFSAGGNKTRQIAEHFQWVHSVARTEIAVRLNAARPEHLPALDVCIQVNVSGETSKSGVAPGEELVLARAIAALPRLRLRGLMAIPEPLPGLEDLDTTLSAGLQFVR